MADKPIYVNNTRTGSVFVRDFDEGIVKSMGAVIRTDDYFLEVPGVLYAPYPEDYRDPSLRNILMPGVMVHFAGPDDRLDSFVYPCIVVRRESMEPADQRWPSEHLKYRAPADGAQYVEVQYGQTTIGGYTEYEEEKGNYPYDITYMISVLASGKRAESDAIAMLKAVLRAYKPKNSWVWVKDSVGDIRTYDAYGEGPSNLAEALDIVDRQRGYSVNVKVEGELDLNDPYVSKTARTLDFGYTNGVP